MLIQVVWFGLTLIVNRVLKINELLISKFILYWELKALHCMHESWICYVFFIWIIWISVFICRACSRPAVCSVKTSGPFTYTSTNQFQYVRDQLNALTVFCMHLSQGFAQLFTSLIVEAIPLLKVTVCWDLPRNSDKKMLVVYLPVKLSRIWFW